MKFPLLAFAALGFLAQVAPDPPTTRQKPIKGEQNGSTPPARGGGTRCGRTLPGHCRLYCHQKERTTFMCDRHKQCCVLRDFLPVPGVSPYASRSKSSGVKNYRKPAQESTTSSNTESTSNPSPATATAPVYKD